MINLQNMIYPKYLHSILQIGMRIFCVGGCDNDRWLFETEIFRLEFFKEKWRG